MNELFFELAIVILTAAILALLVHRLKQPLMVGYILTGVLAGPGLLGLTESTEFLETLSSFGIAFLLFIVGLKLNWRNIRELGKLAVCLGLGQVVITGALGWALSYALGFDQLTGIFLGLALAFSSTIVVVKLLTDQDDIDRLFGRITVGVLIIQDLAAMVLLLGFASVQGGGDIVTVLTQSLGKMLLVIICLFLLAKYIVPHLFRYAASSTELLFVLAIAWCFAVASALQLLGFGIELGALLAGLSLAGTGFQHEIEAKIRVLRDFFLLIFFIVLGTQLVTGDVVSLMIPALILSGFVLIGKPVIVTALMRIGGYHPRTGFSVGSAVAQISEFSFILLGAAAVAQVIPQEAVVLATMVALFTIAGSSYLTTYNEHIFDFLTKFLPGLNLDVHDHEPRAKSTEIILLGYDKMGRKILPMIQTLTKNFLVVDYNPGVIEELEASGHKAVYGDAGSEDLLKYLHADRAKLIVSAIPDMEVNQDITSYLKRHKSSATIILTVKSSKEAERCYELGATYVIVPTIMGGELFASLLKKMKTAKTRWGSLGKKEMESLV